MEALSQYSNDRDNIKKENIHEVYRRYDEQKAWMRDQMQTEEYLNRLIPENRGDVKKAKEIQEQRLSNLRNDYVVESPKKIKADVEGANAYYDYNTSHLPHTIPYYEETIGTHEFQHQATVGNSQMSDYAKNLYAKAFDPNKAPKGVDENKTNWKEYFGKPTELDARKKQLELEMANLGIKKYDETFTKDHYKILLKFLHENRLSSGATDFLLMIKPQYLEEILNNIATTEKEIGDQV